LPLLTKELSKFLKITDFIVLTLVRARESQVDPVWHKKNRSVEINFLEEN